jgi:hypothetical protein
MLVTNKTGSSSDDWIYYQLGYTLTCKGLTTAEESNTT